MANIHALSHAHMARQVTQTATIQTSLALAFDRTMDPGNLDRSFRDFSRYALPTITAGRSIGVTTSDTYYRTAKASLGLGTKVPRLAPPVLTLERATTSLRVTGPVRVKKLVGQGVPVDQAMTTAKLAMLGAAKRLVLEAPRLHLIETTHADSDASGWARVSDGDPCSFCAMLVSRGPVYSEGGVYFEAHDKCGCDVMAVFRNDTSRGWTDDARDFRRQFDDANGDPNVFRTNLAKARSSAPETLATAA